MWERNTAEKLVLATPRATSHAMSNRPSTSSTTYTQQIAPTVPAAIHALAAPTPLLIDSQLPAYLLPCVLALLRGSAGHVVRRKRREENELREEGLLPPLETGKGKGKATEEEMSEVVEGEALKRVERIGLMVGGYVAEKYAETRLDLASGQKC